jgi:hypothetical protein
MRPPLANSVEATVTMTATRPLAAAAFQRDMWNFS